MSDIVLASAHTSLTLFLVISDWRSRTSLAPAWITILLNLRLALASTFKFAKMSGALAPGKQWTMVYIVAEQTSEKRDKVCCFQAGTKEKNKEQIRLIKEY